MCLRAPASFYWNDLNPWDRSETTHGMSTSSTRVCDASFDVLRRESNSLGRTFSEAEDQYGAVGTTLLSDGFVAAVLSGADPNVLGRIIHLNGAPYHGGRCVMPRKLPVSPSHENSALDSRLL